ncbi:GcrA cell cycle regulator [Mesorhizobium sp. B2-4-4]|nr:MULTISPECIES: GcrA cell cycle regulator [unclassified Mesorhizobium]TPI53934.1 GcrA cell cycle regulator [Mesorhizobium sp. B3-1-1]TPJ69469.1 GcrA cell cycle regulator [Mesorhizobium sp. B2-6-7]TPJ86888.1 GcrA cell cycle regulator [Mesorhizobium sp. B2-6-3]TPK02816.1 GcrA cell cycle regulator [Mesorhizobium sp. B2-5-10]TPK09987.1 GcrA cell cycle regulator [Mesorhizobium sp. B2-5-11]
MALYGDKELQAIAGWLTDGLSASRIAARFSASRGSPVSRDAIIGIVHRNAMLSSIGFANSKRIAAAERANDKAADRAAKAGHKRVPKGEGAERLAAREAGVLIADGQAYRLEVPVPHRSPIGRQPHGVAMRFVDCLFGRCRAPLDLALEQNPENDAPGGRPGVHMLCCGMRTRAMKSYCTYHQARFHRRVCEAG